MVLMSKWGLPLRTGRMWSWMPFAVREGVEVLDVGLQTVQKEHIAAKEGQEVTGVLEETAVA